MAPHIEDLLLEAIAQEGKTYILGAEADAADPDPPAFDCSELVQYAADRTGVEPRIPDGAYWQYRTCLIAGNLISVADGIATRGALLFRVTRNPPTHFDDVPHVAWSLGDGTTVEARGRAWGVGSWAAAGRFQAAGIIPGVDYSPGHGQLSEELEMQKNESEALGRVDERVADLENDMDVVLSVLARLDVARAQGTPDHLAEAIAAKLPGVTTEQVKDALRDVLKTGTG